MRLRNPTREDVELLEAFNLTPVTGWNAENENDVSEEIATKQKDLIVNAAV